MQRKTSSSLKVGFLTITALVILLFTVLWIKGRSLSAGERIEVVFHDVNGIRAGSGVQMMGLRIGQIEEIVPVVDGKDSHVKIRFVITEKGVKIPQASTISIQQSGLIGEQFLEVMPPKVENLYLETNKSKTDIKENQDIYMVLSGKLQRIGMVEFAGIIPKNAAPLEYKSQFKTNNALKIGYIIDLPGLILDKGNLNAKLIQDKLIFETKNGSEIEAPDTNAKYTVVEPMRISDFLDLQYKTAHSLTSMNERVMEILSDDFIADIKESMDNINEITQKANSTIEKANTLIDSSKGEIEDILAQTSTLTRKLNVLSDNANAIISSEDLKGAIKSVGKFASNANGFLEKPEAQEMFNNVNEISKNLADISSYVNEFAGDEKIQKELKESIENINNAVKQVNINLSQMNSATDEEKLTINNAISDAIITTRNLKKFSEKLNKRFLLFRLMF